METTPCCRRRGTDRLREEHPNAVDRFARFQSARLSLLVMLMKSTTTGPRRWITGPSRQHPRAYMPCIIASALTTDHWAPKPLEPLLLASPGARSPENRYSGQPLSATWYEPSSR